MLFLFALTLIFEESKAENELSNLNKNDDKAVFPLTMPSLVSPGAIISRVMGRIPSAVAVASILEGFRTYFGI
ncbi:MAG: hypothetical protein ACR2MM_03175 [Flavobacteriaceae bacterium]